MNESTLTAFTDLQARLRTERSTWFVTGVAGFIGSNLLEALLKLDQQVVGLDNFATGHQHNLDEVRTLVSPEQWARFRFIRGDIRELADCQAACAGVDYVLHEAALGSVPRSVADPVLTNSANVTGFLNMLVAARDAGVKRFVYAASSSTYGDHPALPKVEDSIGRPLSPYAVEKLACEQYMRVFASIYGIETLSLRYFNVFGPAQTPDGAYAAAIPRFVDAALSGKPIQIFGDGEQTRDFCFVRNTVGANLLAADSSKKFKGELVNIAGARRISLNDLVKEIARVLGREVAVEHGAPRAGDVRHSLGAIEAAKSLLGYEPAVRWEDGIPSTIEYLRELREHGLAAAARVTWKLWS